MSEPCNLISFDCHKEKGNNIPENNTLDQSCLMFARCRNSNTWAGFYFFKTVFPLAQTESSLKYL